MSDSNIRSDAVDVEQIMRQIRARVREKHGSTYTDPELHQLAAARLSALLDSRGARPELVAELRRRSTPGSIADFREEALYESHRGWMTSLRKLLNPILKLFINPNAFARAMQARHEMDGLVYDVVQNLVVEITRLNLEIQNLKMRVESLSTRMDFDVRRAKALENVPPSRPIQHDRPRQQGRSFGRGPQGAPGPQGSQAPQGPPSSPGPPQASPGQGPQGVQAPASQQAPQASSAPPAAVVSQPGPSGPPQGGQPAGDHQLGVGEPRRRRRRRRRRRPGQGQGTHGQGQGPQGAQGQQNPQGAQGSQAADSRTAAGGDGGGDWDDGDEGASDQ